MNLSFGSLFSGVGGMDLGFLRNDWECKWMVEFDKNAAGVLAHHYPDVPLHCDVEKVDADELEVPDVVLAGFPCQDVSQAGLRKGLHAGTRSSLLWNAIRIIQRLRARGNLRYALFENVPGLFSIDNGLGFARCIRELLSIGCSSVGWTVLDAKDVGWCTSDGRRVRSVPQRRRRIFICASFGDTGEATAREIFSFSSRMSRNTEKGGEEGEGTPANITEGAGAGGGEGVVGILDRAAFNQGKNALYEPQIEITETSPSLVAKGPHAVFKGQTARMQAHGKYECDNLASTIKERDHKDATDLVIQEGIPLPAFSDGTQTASSLTTRSHDQFMPDKGNFSAVIQPQGVDVYNGQVTGEVAASVTAATGISNATGPKVMEANVTPWDGQRARIMDTDGVAPTLQSGADESGNIIPAVCHIGGQTAFNVFGGSKRKDRPSGGFYCEETETTKTLDSASGLNPQANQGGTAVCSWNGDITPKSAEDVSVTLRAQQGGEGTGIAMPMVVRRLTPKECCRLMAWEDDRLDVREALELDGNLWIATGKQVDQADSAKYKQAGNGVASNCSEWIARRMRHVLEG